MPSKIVEELIHKVEKLEKIVLKLEIWLNINTWLTGLMLAGFLAQCWYVVFHK